MFNPITFILIIAESTPDVQSLSVQQGAGKIFI